MLSAQEWLTHARQCRSIALRCETYGDIAMAAYLSAQATRMEELAGLREARGARERVIALRRVPPAE